MKITITCYEGYHIYENMSTIVRSVESECNFGNWTNEIPDECIPSKFIFVRNEISDAI